MKLLMSFIWVLLIVKVNAQNLKEIDSLWRTDDLEKAKNAIDLLLTIDAENIQAWLLKATIYQSIADNVALKDVVADPKKHIFESIQNAVNVDIIKTTEYLKQSNFAIIQQLKQGYTNDGVAFFNAGIDKKDKNDFVQACLQFKKALAVSKFQYQNNWGGSEVDSLLIFKLISAAINADRQQDAYIYASLIANKNIKNYTQYGSFEYVYQWLVAYCKTQQYEDALLKYSAIAIVLYPTSNYYTLNLIKWYSSISNWPKVLDLYNTINLKNIDNELITLNYLQLKFTLIYDSQINTANTVVLKKELETFSKLFGNTTIYLLQGKLYTNEANKLKFTLKRAEQIKMLQFYEMANVYFKKVISSKNYVPANYNEAIKLYAENLGTLKQGNRVKEILKLHKQ